MHKNKNNRFLWYIFLFCMDFSQGAAVRNVSKCLFPNFFSVFMFYYSDFIFLSCFHIPFLLSGLSLGMKSNSRKHSLLSSFPELRSSYLLTQIPVASQLDKLNPASLWKLRRAAGCNYLLLLIHDGLMFFFVFCGLLSFCLGVIDLIGKF